MVSDLSKNLRKVMGDKDDSITALANPVHVLVQLLTSSFLGRAVVVSSMTTNLRVEVSSLYNLNQLSVLEIVVIDDIEAMILSKPYL